MLALSADPLEALIIDFINAGIGRVVSNIEEGIRDRAPVDTGALRESLEVKVLESGGDFLQIEVTSRFESTNAYGLFQDEGRTPYTIEAKGPYSLSDGESFFGPVVNHPGYTKHIGWFTSAPWDKWLCEPYS